MTDLYFFILTAINLFVLLFMCVLIHLSENLKPRQARGFQITFILIGCISILEMISVLVNDGPVWLRWLNILSNYLGFGLTPAVPVCLIYTLQSSDRISAGLKVAAVVEILYFLLLTVSIFTGGLVFAVDEANHYSSSYDMAMIAKELVKHSKILEFSSIYETYLRTDTDNKFWLVNTNKVVY